jgi:hypothetical protein
VLDVQIQAIAQIFRRIDNRAATDHNTPRHKRQYSARIVDTDPVTCGTRRLPMTPTVEKYGAAALAGR